MRFHPRVIWRSGGKGHYGEEHYRDFHFDFEARKFARTLRENGSIDVEIVAVLDEE